ncbi:hypothetical protein [Micromonospora sp. CPCC 206061]|uniref:hypothetical protein n=1 Tax=Micromonospora sp. CPCC 206061 TaxID=3122410 RepID=UPI002FEE8884
MGLSTEVVPGLIRTATNAGYWSRDGLVWEAVTLERVLHTFRQRGTPDSALERWRLRASPLIAAGRSMLAHGIRCGCSACRQATVTG